LLMDPNLQALESKTGLKLEVGGNGADRGVADLLAGRADMAMISAPLADIEKK